MKKIQSLFQRNQTRNYEGDRLVRDEVVPGSEWVLAGEGTPTRKFDGTCCLTRDGRLWKRYEVKRGKKPPEGFDSTGDVDPVTGKQQGWVLVGDGPEDRWHREAFARKEDHQKYPFDGTYELCGPKIQGNPEGFETHRLVRHGAEVIQGLPDPITYFELYRWFLQEGGVEGIVWHHDDGRMVKIKAKDFGIRRDGIGDYLDLPRRGCMTVCLDGEYDKNDLSEILEYLIRIS